MKTTFNIDDNLMRQLREEAARRNTTMTSLVESGIRLVVSRRSDLDPTRAKLPPLPSWPLGIKVDVANRDELYRLIEED